jgi:hypothetical protein
VFLSVVLEDAFFFAGGLVASFKGSVPFYMKQSQEMVFSEKQGHFVAFVERYSARLHASFQAGLQ